MSMDNNLTPKVYQCIISCPVPQLPHIPFIFIVEEDSPHRYVLTTALPDTALSPFAVVGDRQFFSVEIKDIKPTERGILDENLDQVESFDRENLKSAGIPDLAFSYLTLTEYNPTVPELFDGWQDSEHNQELVIISNYQTYQTLSDYLSNTQPETVEVLEYLQKTAGLWKSFGKTNCCETLLKLDNLKIAEDGTLIVEKIYFDDPNNPSLLRQLVETWGYLLEHLGEDYKTIITDLMIKIESGDIDDPQQLRSELEIIIQEMEIESILEEQIMEEGEGAIFVHGKEELNAFVDQFDYEESEDEEVTQINKLDDDDQPTLVLPMRLLSLNSAGLSDVGRRREQNEDCFAIDTNIQNKESPQGTYYEAKGLFILCDGMGGHEGGEVASTMAVKHIYQYFQDHWTDELPEPEIIKECILGANEAIYSTNVEKGQTGSGRMGTTLVLTLLKGTKVAIAHVGDSRIYRITRKWGLEQLTRDHSVAQHEIQHGVESEIAFARPDAYQLTQALGPRNTPFVNPDINYLDIKEDTLLLMCSDGLCDNDLLENHWESALLPLISSKRNLEEGISRIIDLGNQVNGHDNITCLLIRIKVQPRLDQKNLIF